jgi:hypothetical protein
MSGMTELADPRAAISMAAEDRFVELFAEAFGVEKVQFGVLKRRKGNPQARG